MTRASLVTHNGTLALLALGALSAGCYAAQPLPPSCSSDQTFVFPEFGELKRVTEPSSLLFWDDALPLWSLRGVAEAAPTSEIASSFESALDVCFSSISSRPAEEYLAQALTMYRQPRRCSLTGQAATQAPHARHLAGLTKRFCVADGPKAMLVEDGDVRDFTLPSDDPILGVTTAGPDRCVFIQPDAYTVSEPSVTVVLSGSQPLAPADIGGREPWYRLDVDSQSLVVRPRLGITVKVPSGAGFVSGLEEPTLLAVASGTLQLVRLPDVPRDGDAALVVRLPISGYSFRSIVAATGFDDLLYVLAEIDTFASWTNPQQTSGRLLAWVEIDRTQVPGPEASVRMHVVVRGSPARFVWLRNRGVAYLAAIAGQRLGFATLRDGFCWAEGLDLAVETVAGSRQNQILISGETAGSRRLSWFFDEIDDLGEQELEE